jgi:hypothetical protein
MQRVHPRNFQTKMLRNPGAMRVFVVLEVVALAPTRARQNTKPKQHKTQKTQEDTRQKIEIMFDARALSSLLISWQWKATNTRNQSTQSTRVHSLGI